MEQIVQMTEIANTHATKTHNFQKALVVIQQLTRIGEKYSIVWMMCSNQNATF
jgi:hypothetical protein